MAAPTTTGLELHQAHQQQQHHHHQLNHHQQQQTPITTQQQLPHSSHYAHLPQQQQQTTATTTSQHNIQPHPQQHQHQCNCYLPVLKPDVLLNNDRGLFKVYCFIKDFIGASGTSAVAIDNKIEQAMDLVKSHLMIAVREEVEVLKERISELMVKINQLEVENTILKSNMSQETLQQLQMQTQLQIAGATPTNGSNMITAAPIPAAITAAPIAAVQTAAPVMATPQSNMGSGTATPTATQQPNNPHLGTVEHSQEVTQQSANAANTEDYKQEAVQATNGPMS